MVVLFSEILDYYASESAVAVVKLVSTRGLSQLLKSKPEGEHQILQCMIEKFGHSDTENVQRIRNWLHSVSTKHPLMKPDLIRQVNDYLNRPNVSPRGMWCAVSFLTKLKFTSLENEAATLLCGVYMDLFRQLMAYQKVFDELSRSETNSRSAITKKAPGSLDAEVIKRVLGHNALHKKEDPNGPKTSFLNGNDGDRALSKQERRKKKMERRKKRGKRQVNMLEDAQFFKNDLNSVLSGNL